MELAGAGLVSISLKGAAWGKLTGRLGFRVCGARALGSSLGFRVQGSIFRLEGLGFRGFT